MKIKGKYLPKMCHDLIDGKRVHYVVSYSAKARTTYVSYEKDLKAIFKNLKFGNDAPRGGALGNWCELGDGK